MKELINKIVNEAAINEEQAEKAINTVIQFIKDKLPPMMHAAVDNFINTDTQNQEIDPLD